MGQYAYLINRKNRIRCESHKVSGGGECISRIENSDLLGEFLEYCRVNELQIECVSEHWFDQHVDLEKEEPYSDYEN